ncbi:MAG: SDR family NAD(P)-dependent oxidoreductase, partial [Synechococcales bacterium]|nr:SDR family NAD(P)-dependent oxidoreductase [Synechococcales bacterium]
VNLGGVINGIVAAYPQMVKQGYGHIVNISSLAGLTPHPGSTPYTAAKHAVVGLSTSLRIEAAGLGVKVSVACPGPVMTGILDSTKFINIDRDKALNSFPVKKITAQQCAVAVLKGVQSNKSIIVISPFAWRLYWVYRLMPDLLIHLAERMFDGFRQARLQP